METTDQANSKTEWTGVSEVVDKTQNGLYRANITTGLMAVMLVITFSIIHLNGDGGSGDFSFSFFAVWAVVLIILWIAGFISGYVGSSWLPGYTNTMITPNTNLQPSIWVPGPSGVPNLIDMGLGRLIVSSEGISGIILLPCKDIISVRAKDSQNVELLRQERFFGLPTVERRVVLNFQSQQEAANFSEIVTKGISR